MLNFGGVFVYFHPENWGKMNPFLTHIVSDGLVKNHQPQMLSEHWYIHLHENPLNYPVFCRFIDHIIECLGTTADSRNHAPVEVGS